MTVLFNSLIHPKTLDSVMAFFQFAACFLLAYASGAFFRKSIETWRRGQ